jgi:hypothetical protein
VQRCEALGEFHREKVVGMGNSEGDGLVAVVGCGML